MEYSRMGAVGLLALSGCAPTLSSNVASVRTLSRAPELPALRERAIAVESSASSRELLEKPLDADAAVRVALLNNRALRAELRELGIVSGQLLQAGLLANPTFEFELLPERDSRYELRVEYEITSLLMAPLRRKAQGFELEAARLSAAASVVQLGYDVRTQFFDLSAAAQRLSLAQQSLDALAAARDAAQALFEAGNVRALDLSSQTAAYERARVTVALLELEVAEKRERMQRLLGLHGEQTNWQLAEALRDAPDQLNVADDLERRALLANLDLRASERRLDALAKQGGIVRTEAWLPELAADFHALRTKAHDAEGPDEWRYGGGVSVGVPLFDRSQGRLRGIDAQFDALLERYQGLAIDVRSAARECRSRLLSAHARAKQYRAVIVPAQRAVLEQTVLQYNAMQIGIFQLLDARRQLLDVELAYVDTLRDYWTAIAEIEALSQGRVVAVAPRERARAMEASGASEGGH